MNKIIIISILAIFTIGIANSKVIRSVKYTSTPAGIVKIDSIDYRKNLTRVYGKLCGQPHTSMKIENITGAIDIDGIDFKRWFQFEETGIIPIEIDFKPMKVNTFLFEINSTKGKISCKVK